MIACPHCGFMIDADLFADDFAICPFCEKEVELRDKT